MVSRSKRERLREERRKVGQMNNNGRAIQIPGQAPDPGRVPIGVKHMPAPLAQGHLVTVATPGGVQAYVVGGYSQLQEAAIRIAAGRPGMDAETAVQMAVDVLSGCSEYMQQLDDGEPAAPADDQENQDQ